MKDEHYSLIQEPGNKFLGHVTPNSGSSDDIATSVISYLASNDISLKVLVVIGCDGTDVNTGLRNGIIRRIELHLGKPLQGNYRSAIYFNTWMASQPARNIKGPIGEKLMRCETLPVA